MHSIILEMLDKGFQFNLYKKEEKMYFQLEGFYKSGTVDLHVDDNGELIAESRYNKKEVITSFDDMVALNYDWWSSSKDRADFWQTPNEKWLPYLIEMGYVKVEVKTVTKYV